MRKAVFIDKDGTLIPDIPYNVEPSLIVIEHQTKTALRQLKDMGYLLILISNQSGVAHGYFDPQSLRGVTKKIQNELAAVDLQLDAAYYCPHHIDGKVSKFAIDCSCRKPKPGMLLDAIQHFDIDPTRSWMIGDILNDIEAGNRAGCATILLDNGHESEWLKGPYRVPTATIKTFYDAVPIIAEYERETV